MPRFALLEGIVNDFIDDQENKNTRAKMTKDVIKNITRVLQQDKTTSFIYTHSRQQYKDEQKVKIARVLGLQK